MDVIQLKEVLLGAGHASLENEEVVMVSSDRWHHLLKRFPPHGATQLMLAAKRGDLQSVDLLLRCGADLDARDDEDRLAVDYSFDHPDIALVLLQWDSLVSLDGGAWERLRGTVVGPFMEERDNFHRMVREEEDMSVIDGVLKRSKGSFGKRKRRWVNSEGSSALFTAVVNRRYKCWALLRAWGFVYANKNESDSAKTFENDEEPRRCIGEYFVDIDGCHVQKLVAKSKVYRRQEEDNSSLLEQRVSGFFRDIDCYEDTSNILKCLQDDPSLEIVFDFSATNIHCMYPSDTIGHSWGLTEFGLNRIYVTAMESEEFDRSDLVSNLAHELAHKAVAVAFENGGLPFGKSEADNEIKEEYEKIVSEISSKRGEGCYNRIIQRALEGKRVMHELIVRVPEMIIKYPVREGSLSECGVKLLENQVPQLLKFYRDYVTPRIKDYIEANRSAGKAVKSDLLRIHALLTDHWREDICVRESKRSVNEIVHESDGRSELPEAQTFCHNELRILLVSNLSLGVSHLRLSSREKIVFVDWSKYQSARDYFKLLFDKNEISTLAIIWDSPKKVSFCKDRPPCIKSECFARKVESILKRVILIVPKTHYTHIGESKPIGYDYLWDDLSENTQKSVEGKEVTFGGRRMDLMSIVSGVCEGDGVKNKLAELLDAEDISLLIDRDDVEIGRPLKSLLMERRREQWGKTFNCFVTRLLRLRNLELNKKLFTVRTNDVFVVFNAQKNEVEKLQLGETCEWDGERHPCGVRCYTVTGYLSPEKRDELLLEIFRTLMTSSSQIPGEGRWKYVHFFEFSNSKIIHLCSINCRLSDKVSSENVTFHYSGANLLGDIDTNEALILTGAPGSGKSVFVNELARKMRENVRWVDVIDLPLFESSLKKMKETDTSSVEKALDLLYDLVKVGRNEIEKKVFRLFCNLKNKVTIFFDGFDEICPTYRRQVTSLIEKLTSCSQVQVTVTTRTHEVMQLEDSWFTISYCLVPLSMEKQVELVRKEWTASLLSLPESERNSKIMAIVSYLKPRGNLNSEDEQYLLNKLGASGFRKTDDRVTKFLEKLALNIMESMELAYSKPGIEGNLSENPLHAWMLATVAFEKDFKILSKSLSLSELYQCFVDIKICVYLREKAKIKDYVAGDANNSLVKSLTQERLKKLSAWTFLEDKEYRLKDSEKKEMLRIGLVFERGCKVIFVHQTFAEYFFSLWLLEKAELIKVAKILLTDVLLVRKFEKVRQFIDCLLLFDFENDNSIEREDLDEAMTLEVTTVDASECFQAKDLIMNLQMCLYTSIMECHEGIIQYLFQSSGEYLWKIVFGETIWTDVSKEFIIYPVYKEEFISHRGNNTFFLLRQCINNFYQIYPSREGVKYLVVLNKLLMLTREYELLLFFNAQVLLKGRLWWMALDEYDMWSTKEGKKQFGIMCKFFKDNHEILGRTLRDMFLNSGISKLRSLAFYAFELFGDILDSTLSCPDFERVFNGREEFEKLFSQQVWSFGLENVEKMWRYLEKKLMTQAKKRRFLTGKKWNVLSSASHNEKDDRVFPYVCELLIKELDKENMKEMVMDAVKDVRRYPCGSNMRRISKWLIESYIDGYLDADERTCLFLSRNAEGDGLFLDHCSLLFTFQDHLLSGKISSVDTVRDMGGIYIRMSSLWFCNTAWCGNDFIACVERDFEKLLPSLSYLLPDDIQVDERGCLSHVLDGDGQQIPFIQVKAYMVLLGRQLDLEMEYLGQEELLRRVIKDWRENFFNFPLIKAVGGGEKPDWRRTRAYFVRLFFALLSKSLSKENIKDFLLQPIKSYDNALILTLTDRLRDPLTYLALYDLARWCMSEDSLWRVHSMKWKRDGVDQTIIENLLEWNKESFSWDVIEESISLEDILEGNVSF